MVDNHRLDHLYTHRFRDGKGKYFTIVSSDDHGEPSVVEFEHPWPTRNKIKTRLTFIKSDDGGHIKEIELKRFKYYARKGDVETEEGITFSFRSMHSILSGGSSHVPTGAIKLKLSPRSTTTFW